MPIIRSRNTFSTRENEKMLHGITATSHSVSLKSGHALRVGAIALGSALLISAIAFELYAIAVAIAG
jgi:hypothetical protein